MDKKENIKMSSIDAILCCKCNSDQIHFFNYHRLAKKNDKAPATKIELDEPTLFM